MAKLFGSGAPDTNELQMKIDRTVEVQQVLYDACMSIVRMQGDSKDVNLAAAKNALAKAATLLGVNAPSAQAMPVVSAAPAVKKPAAPPVPPPAPAPKPAPAPRPAAPVTPPPPPKPVQAAPVAPVAPKAAPAISSDDDDEFDLESIMKK